MKNFLNLELAIEFYGKVAEQKFARNLRDPLLSAASLISLHIEFHCEGILQVLF